jgi:hypothetical protein
LANNSFDAKDYFINIASTSRDFENLKNPEKRHDEFLIKEKKPRK